MCIGTRKNIQKWVKRSVKPMLSVSDGAVYYYRLNSGISFMLAWIPYDTGEKNKFGDGTYTIEASVRKNDTSYFVEDWSYIGEGIALQTVDQNNDFAAVVDWIYSIAWNYIKPHIYYTLPNNEQIELLSEMRTANFDFGDADQTIAELRKSYLEASDEDERKVIEEEIDRQCYDYANSLGVQYEEIQAMIGIDDLSFQIKQALIAENINETKES